MAKKISKRERVAHVLAYLKKNRLMALGTSLLNKPWAATVFFAYDKNFDILFYSREDTRHCAQIQKNPYVSIVINHNWKEKDGLIKGLQITGRASAALRKDYAHYYAIYKSRFPWADEFTSDHRLYLITPIEIWYIDQKLFGHFNRVKIM